MAPSLKVEIRESIKINSNNTYDSYNHRTITGINDILKRVVTVPTVEKSIVELTTDTGSIHHVYAGDVRYMRFTNLAKELPIILTFKNTDNDEFAVKLGAGLSYIYSGIGTITSGSGEQGASGSGVTYTMDTTGSNASLNDYTGLTGLATITGKSSGSSASDLEYFIASN